MFKRIAAILALAILTIAVAPAEATDTLHVSRSVYTPEKNKEKHPATVVQTITIKQDVESPRICVTYENTGKRSQGHGGADIVLNRVDESQEEFRLSDEVRTNDGRKTFVKCTKADQIADLVPGDTLVFSYEFENMLKLRRTNDVIDQIVVNSVAVANGFPLYVEEVGAMPGEEEKGKKGGWLHTGNFNIQAPKNKAKHPAKISEMVILPEDANAPNICSLYRNTLNKGGKGKVKTIVSFYRDDEMIDSFVFNNKIKKNIARECRVGQDLLAGDIVYFDFEFSGIPRMAKKKAKTDVAEMTGAISRNGEAEFVTVAAPTDPTDPNTPPGPNPPPPSGGFSSADLAAAAKVLYGSRPTQLWRFKNNQPTIWTIIGPGTQLGTGPGGINPSTVGYGNTIAAAVADYEKKRGKLGGASKALSSADVAGLTWFRNINTSQGPTSVRMPRNSGAFVGEFYRPGKGVNHQNFSSFVGAINYFKSNGL
jgi:hypothetical protein